MLKFIDKLGLALENLDKKRDKFLFIFIKKYWPRFITPNHLTYIRLLISIILFVLLFYFNLQNKTVIISLFVIGALTDLFDGSVARCLKMESKFGSFADPIADRLLILPIAIYSLLKIHRWLLLILLLLEVVNGLTSSYAISKDIIKPPNIFAKTKMVLQSFIFGWILLIWPTLPGLLWLNLLWCSAILYIISIFIKIAEFNFPKFNKKIIIKK